MSGVELVILSLLLIPFIDTNNDWCSSNFRFSISR